MQSQNDTLLRLLTMLAHIPRHPRQITVKEIIAKLKSEGFNVSLRTVQRDLLSLSERLPLTSNEKSRPYGWSLRKISEQQFEAAKQLIILGLAKDDITPLMSDHADGNNRNLIASLDIGTTNTVALVGVCAPIRY